MQKEGQWSYKQHLSQFLWKRVNRISIEKKAKTLSFAFSAYNNSVHKEIATLTINLLYSTFNHEWKPELKVRINVTAKGFIKAVWHHYETINGSSYYVSMVNLR